MLLYTPECTNPIFPCNSLSHDHINKQLVESLEFDAEEISISTSPQSTSSLQSDKSKSSKSIFGLYSTSFQSQTRSEFELGFQKASTEAIPESSINVV